MSGPLGTSGGGAAGVTSVTAGNGITVTGTTTPTIAASLAAGTGIGISGTTTLTVSATGVNSVSGGTGISVSGSTSLTVTNSGVTSLAGTGVTVSASTGAVTITAPVVAGGTGISVSGSQTTSLSISNSGVTALAGTGISVSAATGSVTVTPTYAAPTALTIGGTAVTGAAASVANSAHVHAMPGSAVAGASAVGDTAATGSATTVALSDHRHSREAFGTPIAVTGGATAASGSATTIARSDHVHSTASMPVLLASTTLGSAAVSVTVSSIPTTYKHLVVLWSCRSLYAGVNDYLGMVFNSDAWNSGTKFAVWGSSQGYGNVGTVHAATNLAASYDNGGNMWIWNYSSSSQWKTYWGVATSNQGTGVNMSQSQVLEMWKDTAVITAVKFQLTSGANFASGARFDVWGY